MLVDVRVPNVFEHCVFILFIVLCCTFGAFGAILAGVGSVLAALGFFFVSGWLHVDPFGSILTP